MNMKSNYFLKFWIVGLAAFFAAAGGATRAAPLQAQPGASSVVAPADIDEQVFVDFKEWTNQYLAAVTPADKAALESRGVELAKARRAAMFQLIVFDPQRAYDSAVAMRVRQSLPAAVLEPLEKRLSGRSQYAVLAALYNDRETGQSKTRIRRSVALDGRVYHASVYGRRLGVTTKTRMAWHGLALDGYIALHESPLRRLERGEILPAAAVLGNRHRCPVCGQEAAPDIAAEIGGIIYFFESEEHLKQIEKQIEAQEDVIDPEANGLELLEPLNDKPDKP